MFFFLVQEIVKFVATAALDYPYFTWDEAGLYHAAATGSTSMNATAVPSQLRLTSVPPFVMLALLGQTNNSAQTEPPSFRFSFPIPSVLLHLTEHP